MSLLILCCFYYKKYYDNDGNIDFNNDLVGNDLLSDLDEKEQDYLPLCFFDIKGEVVKPGVYSIECDKRINDAILLSGGLTKNSDTSVLNLSKKIEDGMVIIVYSKKEVLNYLETLEKEEKKNSLCNSSNIVNDACDKESNINKNERSLKQFFQRKQLLFHSTLVRTSLKFLAQHDSSVHHHTLSLLSQGTSQRLLFHIPDAVHQYLHADLPLARQLLGYGYWRRAGTLCYLWYHPLSHRERAHSRDDLSILPCRTIGAQC
jgi:DNA uptake protein ComE-like DNA-binding protein